MQRLVLPIVAFPVLVQTHCGGVTEAPTPTCAIPATEAATPVGGDANGDGLVDVSDGIYLQRHLFAGGPAPACPDAVDLVPDGVLDAAEAFALWSALGPQAHAWFPQAGGCSRAPREVEPACGDGLAVGIDAPTSVTGASTAEIAATVTLVTGTVFVEGWSVVVGASGCTIRTATTAGTVAADRRDTPPGFRDGGYAWVDSTLGATARSMVVLDWRSDGVLQGSGSGQPILSLLVDAPVGSACSTCTLTVAPAGDRLDTVVAAEGYRYAPSVGSVSVEVCPA